MNSLFYLAMLVGVGWLMIWAILPPEQRGKGWWPFDMRDSDEEAGQNHKEEELGRLGVRTRRRSHAGVPDAGVTGQQTTANNTPRSWRDRRTRP